MNAWLIGAALAILLVVLYLIFRYTRVEIGHREWNVAAGYDNKAEAAALLARVNGKMIEFMRHLRKKYHIDETADVIAAEGESHARARAAPNDIYNIVNVMLDNYNPDKFYENDPRFSGDTSYTVNKGSSMHICLRDRRNPSQLVDEDVLLFTMIHEAAHIANYSGWGHGDDFWEIFKFLLHEARLAGVYHPVDYSKHPVEFCGINIPWNPYFASNVREIWHDGGKKNEIGGRL